MDNETPAKRTNDPAATISLVFGLLAIVFVVLGSLPFRVVQFNTMPLGLCSIFFAIFAIFFGQQALRRLSAAKQTQGGPVARHQRPHHRIFMAGSGCFLDRLGAVAQYD